jgi:hypothetical protein
VPPREYVHSPTARKRWGIPALGFRLLVPETVQVVRADAFHAVEPGVGELDISLQAAALIMDRDGVLEELIDQAVAELTTQNQATLSAIGMVELPGGEAYRAELDLRDGSPLRHVTLLALGHADFMAPAVLFIRIRSRAPDWEAGRSMLETLRFDR